MQVLYAIWHPHPLKICLGRKVLGRHLENLQIPAGWASFSNYTKYAI